MSADLFAEFGGPSSQSKHHSQSTPIPTPPTTTSAPVSDPFSFFGSSLASALPATIENQLQTQQQQQQQQQLPQWQNLSQWPSSQPFAGAGGSIWGDLGGIGSNKPSVATAPADDEDGWGDFETASPAVTGNLSKPTPSSFSTYSNAAKTPLSSGALHQQQTRIVRASTLDMMSNKLIDVGAGNGSLGLNTMGTHAEQPSQKKTEPRPKNPDPNVLFDADDFDNEAPFDDEDEDENKDDEFGDFETVSVPPPSAPTPMKDFMSSNNSGLVMMAGFSDRASSSTRNAPPNQLLSSSPGLSENGAFPQPQRSPSFQERNPYKGLTVTTPKQDEFDFADGHKQQQPSVKKSVDSPSPVTAWPAPEAKKQSAKESKDVWDALDDFTPEKNPGSETNSAGWDWDAADAVAHHHHQPSSAAVTAVTPFPGTSKKQQANPVPVEKLKAVPGKQQEGKDSSWDWEAETPDQDKAEVQPKIQPRPLDDKAPPPTNIPPPSILLSLFPNLLALPNEALYNPTATQPLAVKGRVLSDPATAAFLRAYLVLATVAARILAGRKHRWHRDKFLSQGMSISAAGGKRGGMKLAGVDKTQTAREDREAAEVVAIWRAHVGRLRAAVAGAAKDDHQESLKVPEIVEKPVITTAKNVPTASKPCVICGLKRDERVKCVDFEVEDSFGEWWVEHWGHRACRNFWAEHEVELRQR